MANLAGVVQQLRKERDQAARVVERLDAALAALSGSSYGKRTGHRRHLSAAAKERIAAAQRARWAKVRGNARQKQNVVSRPKKRTMSAAARKKIAAAQRARWAKEGEGCSEEVRLEWNHPLWMLPSVGRRTHVSAQKGLVGTRGNAIFAQRKCTAFVLPTSDSAGFHRI